MASQDRIEQYLKRVLRGWDPESLRNSEHLFARRAPSTEGAGGLELVEEGGVSARDAVAGLENLSLGRSLSISQIAGLEAIVDADARPAFPLSSIDFVTDHPLWSHLADPANRDNIWQWQRSIGRVEVRGLRIPYGGTAFVVGPGRLMTNRHVAQLFARGIGDRGLTAIAGVTPGFDLAYAPGSGAKIPLKVAGVRMIHPYWDMAVLEVEGLPPEAAPLVLSTADPQAFYDQDVVVIGYPAIDPRNGAADQRKVFKGNFGVKQLQPGKLGAREAIASFGKEVDAVTHDCSTLGGVSGSAVICLQEKVVVGLHFAGLYRVNNFAVPMHELAKDARVRAAGVEFNGGSGPASAVAWREWWDLADSQGVEGAASRPAVDQRASTAAPPPRAATAISADHGTIRFSVPLEITLRLGEQQLTVTPAETSAPLERMVEPLHDTQYASRTGYDANFLGLPVPIPAPRDTSVLARTLSGEDRLDYQNFSILMHAKRRLALVAAANVTAAQALKKPSADKKYTREALSGLVGNDRERWFIDPRLDPAFQLSDVFFTNDDGSFDKGHVIRREDVTWGQTHDAVLRANGDTYHITNCSPQVAGFNQSSKGEDNWGDLENMVFEQAGNERLCVFAAPVLDRNDPRFLGRMGERQRALIQIPTKFWKVIVARTSEGLAAFGFLLEQDLSDVDTSEFVVEDNFLPKLCPLRRIEALTGLVFDRSLRDADQFGERGIELALRAGIEREER